MSALEFTERKQFELGETGWQEFRKNDVIDDLDMKKGCIDIVSQFFTEGKQMDYAENGMEGRCEIANQFYEDIKEEMGITATLCFDPTMAPNELGGYDPQTDTIRLNANYLENGDCTGLMETILHESRHAYQHRCVDHPELSTLSDTLIAAWKENLEHYIRPEFDFVAYENQEVEKDSNYFAGTTLRDGIYNANFA